jgi:hypothetical protein
MIATAISLAIMAFVINAIADMAHRDGPKVIAALQGRSMAAEPKPVRPINVRFRPSCKAAEWARPELRAAA